MTQSSGESSQPVNLGALIDHVIGLRRDAEPLQHLNDAVVASSRLGDLADQLIGFFVDQARRSGATWTEIGEHMGVSKQAAQKRFVAKEDGDNDDELDLQDRRRALTRFTVRARGVIEVAKDEAKRLGANTVLNDHLLLGLIAAREGLAARAIVAAGIPLDDVRDAVLQRQQRARRSKSGSVRFSRETKKTIELSLRCALRLEHNYIGTEHLLLALLDAPDDKTATLLVKLGMRPEATEAWIMDAVAELVRRAAPG